MKVLRYLIVCSIISFLIIGCTMTTKSIYRPVSPTIYTERVKIPVIVKAVIDKRSMGPLVYYQKDLDTVSFDRPVTLIVKEALITEFRHLGLQVLEEKSTSPENTFLVECEVLDFGAVINEAGFFSDTLTLSVALKFKWIAYKSGDVLEENERIEKRTRKIGKGEAPVLPFGIPQIEDYGKQLVNDLLPRVIEKELRLNKLLHK